MEAFSFLRCVRRGKKTKTISTILYATRARHRYSEANFRSSREVRDAQSLGDLIFRKQKVKETRSNDSTSPFISLTQKSRLVRANLYDEHQVSAKSGQQPFPYAGDAAFEDQIRMNGKSLETYSSRRKDFIPMYATQPQWVLCSSSPTYAALQDGSGITVPALGVEIKTQGDVNVKIAEIAQLPETQTFEVTFTDGHRTTVAANSVSPGNRKSKNRQRNGLVQLVTWDGTIASEPPSVQYSDVAASGLGELLHNIRQHGFCFVDDIAATPEATESLLQAIGPIRNTHYGAFYDFTSDLSSKDTAYTSEHLEPHTDNTYFTEPAGLQALHLLSHTDGSGGESSLVDGFGAAAKLFAEDREAYYRLSVTPIHAHASGNEGISIQPAEPVPVLSHNHNTYELKQVRWNNADRAGVQCYPEEMEAWYDAASKFDAIISDPVNQFWFQLTPGRLLIFDNWRILHGRSAFTGKRRMCGGYIPRDDFISKYRMTNMSADDIRASTVTG